MPHIEIDIPAQLPFRCETTMLLFDYDNKKSSPASTEFYRRLQEGRR